MTRPTHFCVDVLYETSVGPACGFDATGKLTDDPEQVTCRKCRKLCGFEPVLDLEPKELPNGRWSVAA